ncbi:MAG: hypothetical protein AAB217_21850 [Chloroflexota bacterium]
MIFDFLHDEGFGVGFAQAVGHGHGGAIHEFAGHGGVNDLAEVGFLVILHPRPERLGHYPHIERHNRALKAKLAVGAGGGIGHLTPIAVNLVEAVAQFLDAVHGDTAHAGEVRHVITPLAAQDVQNGFF